MEMRKLLPEWPALLTEDKWNEFLDFLNLDLEVDAEFWLRFRTLFSAHYRRQNGCCRCF